MTAWIQQIRAGLSRMAADEVARGASLSVALKVVGSALNLVMLTLVARCMRPDAFGVFALWFNAVSLLAVVSGLGQEKLIVRSWNEYVESGRHGLARGALAFGLPVAVGMPALVALTVFAYGWSQGEDLAFLVSACLYLVLQSVFFFSAHATRAIVGIGTGDAHEITWRSIVILGALAAAALRMPFSGATFFVLADIGLVAAMLMQFSAARTRIPPAVMRAPVEMEPAAWSARSLRMWSAAVLEAGNQYLEVILVGLILSPTAAGGYFVAARLANAFAMITGGLYNYSTRQVSRLHYSDSRLELIEALKTMGRLTIVMVAAGVLIVVAAGHVLLGLFGAAFIDQYPTLLILSFGTAFVALAGPSPTVLLLMGREGVYSGIVAVSVALRCLALVALARIFGSTGAALASAGGLIAMAIALNIACRRLVGIDPSPLLLLSPPVRGGAASVRAGRAASGRAGELGRLRVVLLQTQAENAGAQEISRLLGRALAERGHDVRHIFLFRRTHAFDGVPKVTYCARDRPSSPAGVVRLLSKLFRELRTIRPDALLCFQHYGNLLGAPLARLAGVPIVIANQNTAALTTPGLARRLDRLLGGSGVVDRIVVNSGDSEADYAGHSRRYRERLVRIDHGFGRKVSALTRAEARAAFGLPPDGPVIGSVARLHPQKNLAAAIRLLPFDRRWRLALAGQGPDRERLEELARALGCADRVHFLGELPSSEVADFLAALDVFVFPTRAETFGLAAVEAAEAGIPVVANRLPVLEEVLAVDGRPCAAFVDVEQPAAFADAVGRVLDDPSYALELSDRARGLADRYPVEAMADAYEALLRELAPPVLPRPVRP